MYIRTLSKRWSSQKLEKNEVLWKVFLCKYIVTTYKSCPLTFCYKNNGRDKRRKQLQNGEQKWRERRGNANICEHLWGHLLFGRGRAGARLGHQSRRTPLPCGQAPRADGFFPAECGSQLHELPKIYPLEGSGTHLYLKSLGAVTMTNAPCRTLTNGGKLWRYRVS